MIGYGFTNLPTTSGFYNDIQIPLWRPVGTSEQELDAFFLGRVPALSSLDTIYTNAWRDRSRLVTAANGCVAIELACITRHLSEQGIDHA
jgi:hypothetical protein